MLIALCTAQRVGYLENPSHLHVPTVRQVGVGAAQSTCNGNNLIVLPAAVPSDTTGGWVPPLAVDAVHVLLVPRSEGGLAYGVVFNSSSDGTRPHSLVAKGPAVPIGPPPSLGGGGGGSDGRWVRLPVSGPPLGTGTYWIGLLGSNDSTCFGSSAQSGGPATGPGSRDAYAPNPFVNGPEAPAGGQWTLHSDLSFAVYATYV